MTDRQNKIYQKKPARNRVALGFEPAAQREKPERMPMADEVASPSSGFREADRVMLSRYSPPAVLINENMDVLQFRGRTSAFLEPPSGVARFNVLKMAREGLLVELRAAIHAARKQEAPARREGIRIGTDGDSVLVNIEVIPFVAAGRESDQLVLFEQMPEPKPEAKPRRGKKSAEQEQGENPRLRRELEATREYLQSIIEEQEAMNEELRSANEEIPVEQRGAAEHERRAGDGEGRAAVVERRADHAQRRAGESQRRAGAAQQRPANLLASVDLPIIMLDSSLRIRRFNPGAQRVLDLITTDVGRPLSDLKSTLVVDDLEGIIAGVIENLETRELEVQKRNGQWYSLRVRPYKTVDNRIEAAGRAARPVRQVSVS